MKMGIIGSGQLGLMMILEGKKLGIRFNTIDTDTSGPASRLADQAFVYDEFREFVDSSDFVTYEFEHVDSRVLEYARDVGKLRPGMLPVELKRDRSLEKTFLSKKGLPVGEFEIAEDAEEAVNLAKGFSNAVIKSAHGGYDGKGQYFVRDGKIPSEIPEGKYVVEKFVNFQFEASIIGARSASGLTTFFDPSLNVNLKGMLYYNAAPIEDYGMREIVKRLMNEMNYVGVMGVEFFIVDGKALINEFAPRVHNTGHHTLVGSSISQFEQHVRAVCDLPLAEPVLYRPSGIINVVGTEPSAGKIRTILSMPETQYYWYGKSGVRLRRKVGHVNLNGDSLEDVKRKIGVISGVLYEKGLDQYFG